MTAWLAGLPALVRFLVYIVLIVIVLFILGTIAAAFGGADWHLHLGHFFLNVGFTR